jgi:YD repeat-containing protein
MIYNPLNKIRTKTYTDDTPPVTYVYRTKYASSNPNCLGGNDYAVGRLISVSSSVSYYFYSCYDELGRVLRSKQDTSDQEFTYHYFPGFMDSVAYPSGRVVAYTPSNRGLATEAATGATKYASSATYTPSGALQGMTLWNGLQETRGYNSRLQLTRIQAGSLLTILNCYQASDDASNCPSLITTSTNNGNVQGQVITRGTQTWTQKYTYDAVNRLSTSLETNNWSRNYGYDQFGNQWVSSSSGVPINATLTPTSQSAFDTSTNRLAGINNYDVRGNLQTYGSYMLAYDGEGRVISASGIMPSMKYEYDGEGRRVRTHVCSGLTTCNPGSAASTTIYVYDAFGRLALEKEPDSTPPGTSYFTQDHLGSTRLEGNAV